MGWHTIMLVKMFICFSVVSFGNSLITITERSSWISPEVLSHTVEVSLKRSRCANVHVSGNSEAVETFYKVFTETYSHEYVLMDTTDYCNGYLIISTSVDRVANILKTLQGKTTTEMLIIIDDEVEDSSTLFDGTSYGLASVNIVSRNGLRTLSEMISGPRIFKKISSYHEMVRNRRLVNFHGRKLQAAALYAPPFTYLKTTVNRTIKGIKTQVYVSKNEEFELDGLEVKIFLLIADRLNFTWTMRQPPPGEGYGKRSGTHWDGGLIGQIYQKEVDIAFTCIWLMLNNYEFVDMTQPFTEISINFLVPRPKSHRPPWALTTPFTARVWIATFMMLMVQSICIYARAWISPRVPRRFRNFFVTMTELIARLLGNSVTERIPGLKVQFQLWHFIGILLVTAYSSNLAACLASMDYEPRIDTMQDLAAANLTWGMDDRTAPKPYFDKFDPYSEEFIGRFETEHGEAERHAKIMRGKYAIVGKIINRIFIPDNDVRTSDLKNYRTMRDATAKYYVVFAVQPWLLEPMNGVITRLREAGIIEYHLHDVIRRREPPERQEVFNEYDVGTVRPRVLKVIPLTAGFVVLIIGLAISSVVFYLELRCARGKMTIRQLLRRIDRKRKLQREKVNTRKREIFAMKRLRSPDKVFPFIH